MSDIVPDREDRAAQIDNAVQAADNSNRERDARDAQAKADAAAKEAARVKEKVSMGRDDSEANKIRLLKGMEERAVAAKARGDHKKATEIRARMKQLEEMQ